MASREASPGAGESDAAPSAPAVADTAPAPKPRARGPLARIALAVGGGVALIGAIIAAVMGSRAPRSASAVTAATLGGTLSGTPVLADDDGGAIADGSTDDAPADARADAQATWRIAQLAGDDGVALLRGTIERRPLLVALAAAGLSAREAERVAHSLSQARPIDRFGSHDTFAVARDKASGHVVAYEVATSPTDVWQGREETQSDGASKLLVRKLALSSEPVRVRKAIAVGADLRASIAEAGLGPVDDVLTMLDDALEGHAELSDIRPGARLRLVGTQEHVDGVFVRWLSLDAVEYFPAAEHAPSVRVYQFGDGDAPHKHHGWFDAKGRQPVRGGWRMPVPLARIASRFNPHRMHPILHVVMPHNGVDLAAPIGSPVYATAAGVVESVGYAGPCGNRVEIAHPRGMTSVYCHLSRFAAGLHVGEHVEQRQLIAYVGQTGRATGPHLHFGMRRGGVFIDPLSLRLDGVRVVPRARRDDFDRMRAQLDTELDSIPLPAPVAAPAAQTPEPDADIVYDESP